MEQSHHNVHLYPFTPKLTSMQRFLKTQSNPLKKCDWPVEEISLGFSPSAQCSSSWTHRPRRGSPTSLSHKICAFIWVLCFHRCWLDQERIKTCLLQSHLTWEWMPLASIPIADKSQMLVGLLTSRKGALIAVLELFNHTTWSSSAGEFVIELQLFNFTYL